MDELRLSLIVIGVVIIGSIYFLGRMVERSRAVRTAPEREEPEVPSATVPAREAANDFAVNFEHDDDEALEFEHAEQKSTPTSAVLKAKNPIVVPHEPKPDAPPRDPDLIISLTLMARDGQKFRGDELHTALQAAGLELGDFDIYHFCDTDLAEDTRSVFSIANIVKPGTFNAATRRDFTTIGLALFMQVPGPMTASEAFDTMLDKAHFIAQRLRGVVGDQHRTPLSPQRIREMRERTLNYDFTHAQRVDQPHTPSGGRAH